MLKPTYVKYLKLLFIKIKKNYTFLYRNLSIFFIIIILTVSISVYIIPAFSFRLGNVFFGNVKVLYNVKLAQILFKHSVNPIFNISVPEFAHYQLSRTYFIQGNLNTSLYEAQKELELYPENKRTYYIMGLTYGYMNAETAAIKMFSKFIEFKPESWAARNDKAWLQFRIGDIDGAIETLEPIILSTKNNVWIQNTYCALMINKKEFEKAEIACKNAKDVADVMTEASWGVAYPGNDPRIYGTGLQAMKLSIDSNLKIISTNASTDLE